MEELKDLRDIQGLDQISWWPLAIGWWVILGLIVVGLIILAFMWLKKRKYKRSWQYSAYANLQHIKEQLLNLDDAQTRQHKELLDQLSIELRKIAMSTTSRKSCAGLTGKAWLGWLQQHDPLGFAWEQQGELLIFAQYQPSLNIKARPEMLRLISAAMEWVKKC